MQLSVIAFRQTRSPLAKHQTAKRGFALRRSFQSCRLRPHWATHTTARSTSRQEPELRQPMRATHECDKRDYALSLSRCRSVSCLIYQFLDHLIQCRALNIAGTDADEAHDTASIDQESRWDT